MVGNVPRLTLPSTADVDGEILYVPLEFWFNRNAGLALPLIALIARAKQCLVEMLVRRRKTPSNRIKLRETPMYLDTYLHGQNPDNYKDNPQPIGHVT